MPSRNLIIIGGGGHAKACADVITQIKNKYNILGYIDINPVNFHNIPYLGNDNVIKEYVDNNLFLICVGQIRNPEVRKKIFDTLQDLGASLATIISPNSYVSRRAVLGAGTIVMHGSIIQTDVYVGCNCIINDKSLIEHDVVIGNHCHISTGAIINGNVQIGNNVFIGSGAILKNGISVADNTVIGMGTVVTKSTNYNETVVGNPGKTIKN